MSLEGPWFPDPALTPPWRHRPGPVSAPTAASQHSPRSLLTLSLHSLAHAPRGVIPSRTLMRFTSPHPHWPPGTFLLAPRTQVSTAQPLGASSPTSTGSVLCQPPEQGRPGPGGIFSKKPSASSLEGGGCEYERGTGFRGGAGELIPSLS